MVGLGVSNGTDDTAALNALLAAAGGKTAKGMHGQNYLISTPLIVRSGTTLDMTGCTVTLKPGSNCNMLKNAGAIPVSTGAGSITAASLILTTALVATVGQTVTIDGAGGSGTTAHTGTVTAVGSGTLTLSAPARVTVAGAVAKVLTRDSDISVLVNNWDRGANGGTFGTLHSLFFRHIDGLTVDIDGFKSTGGKFTLSVASATNVWARARRLAVSSDGIHFDGPINGARVELVTGSTGDDTFAITGNDWAGYGDSSGDVTNVSVGSIIATSTGANLFKVIAGAGNLVDAVKVDSIIAGTAAQSAAWVGDDIAQSATIGGTYGIVDCGLITANAVSSIVVLPSPTAACIRARISNKQTTTLPFYVNVIGTTTATIGLLDVQIAGDASATPGFVAAVQISAVNTTIQNLLIHGGYFVGTPTGNPSLVTLFLGTVIDATVRDVSATFVVPANPYYFRYLGGSLSRVNLNGGSVSGGIGLVFRRDAAATVGAPVVTMSGGFAVAGVNRVAGCYAGTTTFKFAGAHFDTIALGAFYTSSGTLIFDGAISTAGIFVMLQWSAAESVRSLGGSLPFDLSMLAKANGDAAYNTNAALACGVGVADSNGTNWKNRYTAAVY